MITELEMEEKKAQNFYDKKIRKAKKKEPKKYNRRYLGPTSVMPRSAFNRKSYF